MRPKQWTKNVLVLAAPAAAGVLTQADAAADTALTFVAFCLVSSSVYCLNDTVDAANDRLHHRKKHRPVASGAVSAGQATTLGAALLVVGLALGAAADLGVLGLLALYVALQAAYSFGLKREPVVELAIVASGFVLRTIAGGVATDVPLSSWFLGVAGCSALLVVSAKRLAELQHLGEDASSHRAVLEEYSVVFLQLIVAIFGTLIIVVYFAWAFEADPQTATSREPLPIQLSTIPLVVAVLRYVLIAERGEGGEPEDVVLQHRALQVLGGAWAALFLIGVLGG